MDEIEAVTTWRGGGVPRGVGEGRGDRALEEWLGARCSLALWTNSLCLSPGSEGLERGLLFVREGQGVWAARLDPFPFLAKHRSYWPSQGWGWGVTSKVGASLHCSPARLSSQIPVQGGTLLPPSPTPSTRSFPVVSCFAFYPETCGTP